MAEKEVYILVAELVKVETRIQELMKLLDKTPPFEGHDLVDEFMALLEKREELRQQARSAYKK